MPEGEVTRFWDVEAFDTVADYGFKATNTIFPFVYISDALILDFIQCHVFRVCGNERQVRNKGTW